MKISDLKNNIGYIFVSYILVFSSFTALLSTTIQLFFEYKRDIAYIEKTVSQIKKSHVDTIIQALWTYDISILETQLQGIRNLPDVIYASVEKDNKTIVTAGKKGVDKHFSSYAFPLYRKYQEQIIQLGMLKVEISMAGVYQHLWDRVVIISITQSLKALFVSIFIFFLFYSIVGRHLKTMAAFAQSIHLKNLDDPLVLKRKPGRSNNLDELGLVESAMNSMRCNLINEMNIVRISQDALVKSEERFRSLVDNIPGIIYRRSVSETWEVDYISDLVSKITGYQPQDFLTGRISFPRLIHQEDLVKISKTVSSHVLDGESFEIEYRILHKDGSVRSLMEKGKALYDSDCKPLWLDGVILDVTEKLQIEKRLKEKDFLLHSIIENTTDAVFLKDLSGRYVMANTAALKAIGQPEAVVMGKTDFELFPKESAQIINHVDSQVMISGKNRIEEEELQTSYGKTYWQANKSPLKDSAGNVIGLIGISRNITDFKLVQIHNEELEKKLVQAQKIESVGNLAGGIAHDFNNILAPIVGISELLLEDLPQNSQEYKNVQEILRAGKRGSDLVKQILAFSRKSENKFIPVCAQKIITEVLNLARAAIPSDIEINQDIQSGGGLIMADPTQIHQVAMNIITNAFHAVEDKGGQIIVQLKELSLETVDLIEDLPGGVQYILLSVTDTGRGISPDLIDKIFEPYFTTKEQGKGTGLGLFVVYGIIKKHNGHIKVDSKIGSGTTFNIYLPMINKSVGIRPDIAIEENYSGTERILIVDDDESIVKLEKMILERLGYLVTEKTSSVEALNFFTANPDAVDLVISDMTMPNMTGDQLVRKIKVIRPDIPVIICTGFSTKLNEENAGAIGVNGFLMKPVVKSEMTKMVRKVLDDTKNI